MGRPREFDIDEALHAALLAFWKKGYEATSMADLMEAMDLRKGSIYKAYGDKHQLFMSALTRYMDRNITNLRTLVESKKPALDILSSYFYRAIDQFNQNETHVRCGCFSANTAVELGPHDEEVGMLLQNKNNQIMQLLTDAIAQGQEKEDIRTDRPPEELAEVVHTALNGIASGSKRLLDLSAQRRVADFVLETLKKP